MIKIDELNSKIDGLEKILNTKNDILQQTKDERDQINIQNQKREIQVDSAKIDLMTQAEQNSGTVSDWLSAWPFPIGYRERRVRNLPSFEEAGAQPERTVHDGRTTND